MSLSKVLMTQDFQEMPAALKTVIKHLIDPKPRRKLKCFLPILELNQQLQKDNYG